MAIQLYDGDGFLIPKEGGTIKFSCCDCGLTHDFVLSIEEDGSIKFIVKGNNRSTGQIRRWRKKSQNQTKGQ
jgi:hypothetical protein